MGISINAGNLTLRRPAWNRMDADIVK